MKIDSRDAAYLSFIAKFAVLGDIKRAEWILAKLSADAKPIGDAIVANDSSNACAVDYRRWAAEICAVKKPTCCVD